MKIFKVGIQSESFMGISRIKLISAETPEGAIGRMKQLLRDAHEATDYRIVMVEEIGEIE